MTGLAGVRLEQVHTVEEDREWRVWAMESELHKEETEDRRIMVGRWWGWRTKIKVCRGGS